MPNHKIDPDRQEKRCPACGEIKSIDNFHRNRWANDGHAQYCKLCACIWKRKKYWNDPEKIRARLRTRTAEKQREYNKKYYNPEITAECCRKRRNRKKGLLADFTSSQWHELLKKFNHLCAYCDAKVKLHQDHITSLFHGGEYTSGNIVPACKSCNSSKGIKGMREWLDDEDRYIFIMDMVSV